MKGFQTLTVLVVLATVVGCEPAPGNPHGKSLTNEWLVRSYSDDAIKNAIIAQHTLYPYHFHTNGATLNELGQNDLTVLINHFKDYPGQLNVRRGDEAAKLHSARVKTVVDALKRGGVQAARLQFAEALPGGDGMASERVVRILDTPRRQSQQSAGRGQSAGARTTSVEGVK